MFNTFIFDQMKVGMDCDVMHQLKYIQQCIILRFDFSNLENLAHSQVYHSLFTEPDKLQKYDVEKFVRNSRHGIKSSAAAHDYSRMSTLREEVADQSHPQNTQQRMLKVKESIRKKKQRILAIKKSDMKSVKKQKKKSPKKKGVKNVRNLKKKTATKKAAKKATRRTRL